MTLMFITNDPDLARYVTDAGVDRVFVDLESRGKEDRQGHLDTHRALHTAADVQALRRAVPAAQILARVNPLYEKSALEIDAVVEAGADLVMLPMFTSAEDVEHFLDLVGERSRTSLLLETPQALARVDDILAHRARINEIHIGLNDLHLGLRLDFMFEVVSGGLLGFLSETIRRAGIRFGFGGIARIGEGAVPAELVIGEHVRLGSEMVILSRTFHQRSGTLRELQMRVDVAEEVRKIRACVARFRSGGRDVLEANRRRLQHEVRRVALERREALMAVPA